MSAAVGVEPTHGSVGVPRDAPAVFVDELVVERPDEEQVRQVGAATIAPLSEVMGLGESPSAASGESTFAVPVANLTNHPRGRLARGATEAEQLTGGALDNRLDTRRAQQAVE